MLKNKIPKIKQKKQISLTQKQQHSHELDQSDMDFFTNVVDNLTPRKPSLGKLQSLGRKMSENLRQNTEVQNCIQFNRVQVQKKKSLNFKEKKPLKQFKTSLNNKFSSKPTLFNKKQSKKKIEIVRSVKERKSSFQNITQEQKSSVKSIKNTEEQVWNIIEEMDQDKLENFMQKISAFYDEKFSCKVKQNQLSQEEIDDSQMTRKNPLSSKDDSKKSDNNQIDKLRFELEEIKTMIKKMNN